MTFHLMILRNLFSCMDCSALKKGGVRNNEENVILKHFYSRENKMHLDIEYMYDYMIFFHKQKNVPFGGLEYIVVYNMSTFIIYLCVY